MAIKAKYIALFDICDTLYYSNTTFDFIYYYLRFFDETGKLRRFKRLMDKRKAIFWIYIIYSRLTGNDIIKKRVVKLLKGVSKEKLYEIGKSFAEMLTTDKKINETHTLVEEYRGRGFGIVLGSASIDPVVHNIAHLLNADYYCTTLGYDSNGICTGKIVNDLTGRKYDAIRKDLETNKVEHWAAVSDNKSDMLLLANAHAKHMVIYQDADKSLWGGLEGSFILLKKRPYLYE